MIPALLDHMWQSTLYAAAAGLLTLALRGNGARIRYWIWLSASVKFLIPLHLLVALGDRLGQWLAPVPVTSGTILFQQAVEPFSAAPVWDNASAAVTPFPADWTWPLLALWASGALLVVSAWLARWSRLSAALGAAVPSPGDGALTVKLSTSVMEPGLVGLWRPILLMPEGIATRLAPGELAIVLAHEICHWRRRDNLTALLHMLVETLFWFYPLVWWLGARLVDERERACDESVLAAGHDPQIYAESLLKICRFYVQSPLTCVSGLSGADLRKRIETIVRNRVLNPLDTARKSLLGVTAAAAMVLPLAAGLLQSPLALARAEDGTPREIALRRAEQQRPRRTITLSPAAFDRFTGHYAVTPLMMFTVFRRGDHFYASLTGQEPIEIFPEGPTKFFARLMPGQLSFESDAQGRVTTLVQHQGGLEHRAPRLDDAGVRRTEDALALRIKSDRPLPGSEAALRHLLDGLREGKSPYDLMPPRAALDFISSPAILQVKPILGRLGPVKTLSFRDVDATGRDRYVAIFAHGQALAPGRFNEDRAEPEDRLDFLRNKQ